MQKEAIFADATYDNTIMTVSTRLYSQENNYNEHHEWI